MLTVIGSGRGRGRCRGRRRNRGRGRKTATKAAETAKTATKTAKTVTKASKTLAVRALAFARLSFLCRSSTVFVQFLHLIRTGSEGFLLARTSPPYQLVSQLGGCVLVAAATRPEDALSMVTEDSFAIHSTKLGEKFKFKFNVNQNEKRKQKRNG